MTPRPTAADPAEPADTAASAGPASLTRRHAVLGGTVGAVAVGGSVGLDATRPADAALPLVRPLRAHRVYRRFGVNAFPNKLTTNYRHHRQWMNAADALGAHYFRGLYAPGLPKTRTVVRRARRLGLRWVVQVAPDTTTSNREIRRTIAHLARHAADVVIAVEGVNEPDWDRSRGRRPRGWKKPTMRIQRQIWRAVKSHPELAHVKVVGPTLREVSSTRRDYVSLRERGILDYLDIAPIHCYPNGRYPGYRMGERIRKVRRAWPRTPVWINETGYHNALSNTSGHKPVPEWVAARYAPAAVLEAADRRVRLTWFELLDQPDAGARNDREANFGLFALRRNDPGPPWRQKPAAAELRTLLRTLKDPGRPFKPAQVRFKVTSPTGDVRATLTAKRDGTVHAHLRRAVDCWDPLRQRPISVATVTATVHTSGGRRRVDVGHRVVTITL